MLRVDLRGRCSRWACTVLEPAPSCRLAAVSNGSRCLRIAPGPDASRSQVDEHVPPSLQQPARLAAEREKRTVWLAVRRSPGTRAL